MNFELRFNLRQTKVEKPTLIYAVYTWQGKQYKVSTSLKVYPSQWDNRTHSALISSKQNKLDNRNNQITNQRIVNIITSLKNIRPVLCDMIDTINVIDELSKIINPNIKKKKMKKQPIISTLMWLAEKYEKNSFRHYKGCIDRFEKYLISKGVEDKITNLNGDTLNDYQDYLSDSGKQYKTINSYLKNLITLINLANAEKELLSSKIDYSSFKMIRDKRTTEQKKSKQVPLTEVQLLDIYHLNGITEKEEEARDLFICQCLLGQRISDMPKIFKGEYTTNVHGEGLETISFNVQKTKEEATLYLFPIAKEIITKYRNKQFKYYNLFEEDEDRINYLERIINNDIKKVCQKAGLTAEINYTVQIGGEVKNERKQLYKLMHTHIARHTFITLMCKMGVSKDVVIIATAHTDIKMINDVYLHETANDKGKKFIKELQKTGNQSKLFVVPSAISNDKTVLNSLFAYNILLNISELMNNNVDAFHTDNTKKAISILKDVSTLNNYAKEIDKEKVMALDGIVFELSYYFRDAQLYSIFQFKEYYFGIIKNVASYDDVNMMFANEDIERPKQQLESDIEEYEKYLKGE